MSIDHIVNVYEQTPAAEVFFDRERFQHARWQGYSGLPGNRIEHLIQRPKISRYRAAMQTAWFARTNPRAAVISHLPAMTAATGTALRWVGADAPHLAFAFNFTDLPTGSRQRYMQRAFADVRRFTVFSHHEAGLYSDYFQLPLERFEAIRWTQGTPPVELPADIPFGGEYLCAIGGEDRDYRLLTRFARTSQIPVLIIGRPNSVDPADLGPHVRFLANQPHALTWGYAVRSRGMVLPLKSSGSRCGQITLVSAALLGIPTLAADTAALKEYLEDGLQQRYEAGSLDDLTAKARDLFEHSETLRQQAQQHVPRCKAQYDRHHWTLAVERQLASV